MTGIGLVWLLNVDPDPKLKNLRYHLDVTEVKMHTNDGVPDLSYHNTARRDLGGIRAM